jgi:hypothetical protein
MMIDPNHSYVEKGGEEADVGRPLLHKRPQQPSVTMRRCPQVEHEKRHRDGKDAVAQRRRATDARARRIITPPRSVLGLCPGHRHLLCCAMMIASQVKMWAIGALGA